MAVSGSYSYAPSNGDLTLQAFQMCGVRPTSLTAEHMVTARTASNLMLGRWSSQGVNLWQVDLQTIPLVAGTTTYTVDPTTIAILDAYTVQGSGAATNRIITSVSRSEYANYSNPSQQGAVSTYWFNRLLAPEISFYLTPDGTQTSVDFYRLRQSMDNNLASGGSPEVPYYFLEAFALGLASRLAIIWAPDRAQGLKMLADEAYLIAAEQNIESAPIYVSPMLGGYWRP